VRKAKRKYHTIPTMAELFDPRAYRDPHLAIIEKIRDGKPLGPDGCAYVAEWLMETWLPKHEVNALRQRRYWESIEMLIQTGMYFSPDRRKPSRKNAVARIATELGVTLEALEQRLKEHKTARRLRWADNPVFADMVAASSKPAEPIKRKRR
jgi:hypothetical protein